MMELFWENNQWKKTFKYFSKKSYIIDVWKGTKYFL